MKEKIIWILIIFVLLSLVGLIGLQAFWIENAFNVKEKQFKQQVNIALTSIVKYIQEEEITLLLVKELNSMPEDSLIKAKKNLSDQNHKTGLKNDSKPFKYSKEIYLSSQQHHQKLNTDIAVIPKHHEKNKKGNSVQAKNASSDSIKKELKIADIRNTYLNNFRNRKLLVENIINKLSKTHPKIEKRIDKRNLERIIKVELVLNRINLPYEYSVKDEEGNVIYRSDSFNDKDSNNLYMARLFPEDIFDHPYFLSIYFPDESNYIFHSIKFIVISSITLTAIIVIIVFLSFYIIFRQNRIRMITNDFINNMTHELKTPISTISLASQLLGDNSVPVENKNIDHISRMILGECTRLGTLVEKVLQMAVFEHERFKTLPKKLNINSLIDSIIDNYSIQIKSKNGKLFKELNAENPFVFVDEVHMSNVIINLLDNALKYCQTEPVIIVSTRNENNSVVVIVKDNGIGISKEYQKKIFDKFYRVPTGNVHNVKGFGLGLSYVRKIVLTHKGSVSLESKVGQGSIFSIYLPKEEITK
jgi:two-component system, OmpR family, phosphate regulon sensor histidine kinase PhoR